MRSVRIWGGKRDITDISRVWGREKGEEKGEEKGTSLGRKKGEEKGTSLISGFSRPPERRWNGEMGRCSLPASASHWSRIGCGDRDGFRVSVIHPIQKLADGRKDSRAVPRGSSR